MTRPNNKTLEEIDLLDEELRSQIKKSTLMDGDRKEFIQQAEETKEKNKEWLDKLKQENKKLKTLRDQLICNHKVNRDSRSKTFNTTNEIRNQEFYRRQLDKERHKTKTKKQMLTNMQDKLKEVEDNKVSLIQQSPLMRNIRILQNRLDKVMIKFNEAHSIQKSYEQIVKRLKEERVGYDNQITAIQRSLKGKEQDFEELLLLAHDATHAKELAQAELKKFEHKRSAIKDLREKYIQEKKNVIDNKKDQLGAHEEEEVDREGINEQDQELGELSFEQQELMEYQEAFRKLKQVTGVVDANEIIQKFKTQGQTAKSLADLKDSYRVKLEQLRNQKQNLKHRLENYKFQQAPQSKIGPLVNRRKVDELQSNYNKLVSECERAKVRQQRIDKILVNVKAGIEHLNKYIEFYKIADQPEITINEHNLQLALSIINEKLFKCYGAIKKDPQYRPDKFKQSSMGLEKYLSKNENLLLQNNNRVFKNDQEPSDHEYDEELTDETSTKIKQKNMQFKQNANQDTQSKIKKVRKLVKPL